MAFRVLAGRQAATLAASARVGGRFFSSTRAVASLSDSVKQAIKVSLVFCSSNQFNSYIISKTSIDIFSLFCLLQ